MNFLQMQTYISRRLLDPNNTAVSLEDVKGAINDAISYWKLRRFWFNEVSDFAFLTAQDPNFPYPDDFLVPALQNDGFNIEYGGIRYTLAKVSESVYDGIWLANGYGLPQYYARLGDDEYQCYPIPDRNYQVNRHYLKDFDDLVDDGDENDFTIYASRLINLWSLANLSGELRQDEKMEQYYRSGANNEYNNLLVMTAKSNATGTLTTNSILTTDW